MKITDRVTLGDVRVSDAGYLEANARTARVGIQQYLGSEVGRSDMNVVNVYRDEAEVFSKQSLETFSKIPVTLDHPRDPVTADNWKSVAVGTTGDEVLRDGEYLKIGLKITDADAVKAIQNGKRELSVGYSTDLVWEDGVAPDGTPYQARQTAIVADHIAIVSQARAGPQARIGDGASWGARALSTQDRTKEKSMSDKPLKTVTVDGISIEVTDQGAQVIAKLQQQLSDATAAKDKTVADHDAAIKAKDAELAKKDAEIDGLKAKVLDGAALDAAVQARGDLLAKAKAIAPDVKTDGLADAEIRKAVVVAKLGDAMKDKAEAYIDARFDILAEDAAGDEKVRDAITNLKPQIGDARAQADKAWNDSVTDMNAWRNAKEA